MIKVCPIRAATMHAMNADCIREYCAWWCKFAGQCAIPLAAEILADSDICNNVFGEVYTKKDGDNDG